MFFAFDCKLHYLNKGGVTTQQLRIGLAHTQIANAASSPVVLNNSIYFKSNYKLKTPQTPTPSQEIYQISTTDHTITNKIQITSSAF